MEVIIIDRSYVYEVEKILEGGIGYVRLMSLKEYSKKPPAVEAEFDLTVKYPYRDQLAAKTIKYKDRMDTFARECELWIKLKEPGIVPLLKVIKNGEQELALMPRYAGDLRSLLSGRKIGRDEYFRAIYQVLVGLSKIHDEQGIVHLDIKPENLLYTYHDGKLFLELSDWGIARVQAEMLKGSEPRDLKRLSGFGSIPFLAPERFENYISDVRADMFSLGMVFFIMAKGYLPYKAKKSVAAQLRSGEYYENAKISLPNHSHDKIENLILRMLHPDPDERLQDYKEVLRLINASLE